MDGIRASYYKIYLFIQLHVCTVLAAYYNTSKTFREIKISRDNRNVKTNFSYAAVSRLLADEWIWRLEIHTQSSNTIWFLREFVCLYLQQKVRFVRKHITIFSAYMTNSVRITNFLQMCWA